MDIFKYVLSLILFSFVLSGCVESDAGGDTDLEEANNQNGAETEAPSAAFLPGMGGDQDCAADGPQTEICEWLLAPELIVTGVISDVRLSERYSLSGNQDSDQTVGTCTGYGTRGLEIDLDLIDVLEGEFSEEEMTVYIGGDIVNSWEFHPIYDSSEEIMWRGDENSDYLAVGDALGAMLYYNESEELWTTSREPLFSIDTNNMLQFQSFSHLDVDAESCGWAPTWEVDGGTSSQLTAALDGCASEVGIEDNRYEVMTRTAQQVSTAFASTCHEAPF